MSVWIYVIIVGAGAPRRVSVTAERRGTDKPTPTGSCVAVTITRGTPNGGGGGGEGSAWISNNLYDYVRSC